MKIFSSKLIYASLILIIIFSFIINSVFNDNKNSQSVLLNKIPQNVGKEKIFGVKIRQQNEKGEKILIVAESLLEKNSLDKKVVLENSLTTIEQNGIVTNIKAGYAIISNNYDDFEYSDNVKIIKKKKKFNFKN